MFSRRRNLLTSVSSGVLASSASDPPFVPGDPYREHVILDVRQGSVDAQDNNSFTDESSSAHIITANGDVSQGSFSPHQPNGWSVFFDGTDDYLSVADHADFEFGSGDFCIECRIKISKNASAADGIFSKRASSASTQGVNLLFLSSSNTLQFLASTTGGWNVNVTTTTGLELGVWHHVAVVRNGNDWKIYIDGIEAGTQTHSGTVADHSAAFVIGATSAAGDFLLDSAVINDFRVVKGSAVYTADFSPPEEKLTVVTNTVFLTCQDNRFVDNSTSDHNITANNGPAIVAGAPYAHKVAYDPATHGGSAFFDGTGDYLTAPDHADFTVGTNQFTIRGWFYMTARSSAYDSLIGQLAGLFLFMQTSTFQLFRNGASALVSWTYTPTFNEWTHFEVTRDGSNDIRLFINGTQVGSTTNSAASFNDNSNVLSVGSQNTGASTTLFNGFLADMEYKVGVAEHTADFSVPTSPPTADSNTKFLALMQSASIYDASCNSNLVLTGNTETDTGQVKHEDASVLFDGTGDFVSATAATKDFQAIGTQDFTIEFWARPTALSGSDVFLDWRDNTSGLVVPVVYTEASVLKFWVNSANRITGSTLSTGTWYYIAVSRFNGTTKMFLNGVQDGSDYADTNDYIAPTGNGINIGGPTTTVEFTGNIEGLRITKGFARYLGDFTPPTAPHHKTHGYLTDAESTVDDHWDKTALLLKTSSSDAGDNDDFTDSSSSPHTITTVGAPYQGSDSPYRPYGFGAIYEDGHTADPWDITMSTWSSFGTGAFTIECFIRPETLDDRSYIYRMALVEDNLYIEPDGSLVTAGMGGGSSAAGVIEVGTTYHVVMVRDGSNNCALFVEGTRVANWTHSSSVGAATNLFRIGAYNVSDASADAFVGEMSNFRVVKGTAVYDPTSSSITVPTAPLSAITNTELLTMAFGGSLDRSGNALAVTVGTTGSLPSPVNMFNLDTVYDAVLHGGSAYFDGVDDELTVPNSSDFQFGTGDFCIEFWYRGDTSDTGTIVGMDQGSNNEWAMVLNGALYCQQNNSVSNLMNTASGALTDGSWHHVAWTRSGSSNYLFVDGIEVDTATNSTDYSGTEQITIMGDSHASTGYPEGQICDLRIVKGSAVYTSDFTPPTAPLTAITNTVFLMHANEAEIYDASAASLMKPEGSAQTDTGIFKFGPTSVLFDGTGDGLVVPVSPKHEMGTRDFCIEGWVYLNVNQDYNYIFMSRTAGGSQPQIDFYVDTAGTIHYYVNGSNQMSHPGLDEDVWYYVTVSRVNGATRLFVNGVVVDQWLDTTDYSNGTNWYIGMSYDSASNAWFDGNIEDLRVTVGEGRYEADFQIPTSDLPKGGA